MGFYYTFFHRLLSRSVISLSKSPDKGVYWTQIVADIQGYINWQVGFFSKNLKVMLRSIWVALLWFSLILLFWSMTNAKGWIIRRTFYFLSKNPNKGPETYLLVWKQLIFQLLSLRQHEGLQRSLKNSWHINIRELSCSHKATFIHMCHKGS